MLSQRTCLLSGKHGKGFSYGTRDRGGGSTRKGSEYPWDITLRTQRSDVICCHADRKRDSLPPTGKLPI